MLRLGIADELRTLFAIVLLLLPLREHLAAISVAHFADKICSRPFDGAIAKRIHGDAERHPRQGIALFRSRQDRRLTTEPPQVADEHQHQQTGCADGNPEMSLGKLHSIKCLLKAISPQGYERNLRNAGTREVWALCDRAVSDGPLRLRSRFFAARATELSGGGPDPSPVCLFPIASV